MSGYFADNVFKSSTSASSQRMVRGSKVRTRRVMMNVVLVRNDRARIPVCRLVVGPKDVFRGL